MPEAMNHDLLLGSLAPHPLNQTLFFATIYNFPRAYFIPNFVLAFSYFASNIFQLYNMTKFTESAQNLEFYCVLYDAL